jgi:hypothetical protein
VKHSSLRSRVAKIEKRLALKSAVVRIEGGLPDNYQPLAAKPPEPPGGEWLAAQAAMAKRPPASATPAPPAAEPVEAPPAKRA